MEDEILPIDDESIPEYTCEEMDIPEKRRGEIKELLNPIELEIYDEWRISLAQWVHYCGKYPSTRDGYARNSMSNIMNRIEKFAAWVYQSDEYGFTTDFREEHVDSYWNKKLCRGDNTIKSDRREINNIAIILKPNGIDYDIPDSKEVYRRINKNRNDRLGDYFEVPELLKIKNAATRAHMVPPRDTLSADEIDEWEATLAQRLEKPKEDITDDDWEASNSYKIPSLVYTSLDVGFRPTEIESSNMGWVRLDDSHDAAIHIPRDEDSKSGKNDWKCYLSHETAVVLKRWIAERDDLDVYDDTDAIWLNDAGNPYNSKSLRYMLGEKLMPAADISTRNREQGWYMIRRGVGTSIGNEKGLSPLMSQLRINRIETARKYIKDDKPAIKDWQATRW